MKGWPEEIVEWLREYVPGHTTKEVTTEINKQGYDKKYGMIFTEGQIKGAKNRYKIKSETKCGTPKGYSLIYPKGMQDYIKSIAEGRTTKEIAKMVSKHFNIEFSEKQCRAYKKNHGIQSGVDAKFKKGHIPQNKGKPMSAEQYKKCKDTMFKKGNIPNNKMKVGEYTHTTDGYLIQKIKEKGTQQERFEFVHRRVWEKHNGPIPEGKMVSFLDGNKDNCAPENLILIDNSINLEMNRRKLRSNIQEVTKTGVHIAKLNIAIRERRSNGHSKK